MESADDMETVFETTVPEEALVVRSVLEAAGVPFFARGEDAYDAFRGAFRGTVFSRRGRRIVFLVPAEWAESARELLSADTPAEGDEAD